MLDLRAVNWRRWFVDIPAQVTEVGMVWYRAYLMVVLVIGAFVVPVVGLIALVLWFGFGIRWGW